MQRSNTKVLKPGSRSGGPARKAASPSKAIPPGKAAIPPNATAPRKASLRPEAAASQKARTRNAAASRKAAPSRKATPVAAKLREYGRKREPSRTTEPFEPGTGDGFFVVQKHAARRLHYDFRLAMGGVLVSWAVPKGPSYDTRERRLAVHVEDHPLSYRDFEGTIPKGEYGGGSVIVWDKGPYRLREGSVPKGSLKLDLFGRKLVGKWALVRMKGRKEGEDNWLLLKERDEHVDPKRDVAAEEPESVLSGLTVEEIGQVKGAAQWNSGVRRMIEELPDGAASEGRMPAATAFMKARLVADVPRGEGWLFEIKLDGVRALAIRQGGEVRLVTRNRKEVAFRYPEVASALAKLPGGDFAMDGEIVAFDPEGRSRFELLQGRIHLAGEAQIARAAAALPAHYYAFDLTYAEGHRLEDAHLVDRKRVLARWLEQAPPGVRFSDHVTDNGEAFLDLACGRGLEGMIAKRAGAPYRGARSGDWVKVKCLNRQELVIGGWTPPKGGRSHFGSLLLGVHEGDRLVYAGKVGTGFDARSLADLHRRLKKLERDVSPFADPPRERGVRWVEPKLVAEVRFTEWTSDGKLRHPAFVGLRDDKEPGDCVREMPMISGPAPAADGRSASTGSRGSAVRLRAGAGSGESTVWPRAGAESEGSEASRRAGARSEGSRVRRPTTGGPSRTSGTQKAARKRGGRAALPPTPKLARTRASEKAERTGGGTRAKGAAQVPAAAGKRPAPAAATPAPAAVEITNPRKIYFPKSGITKGEVAEYYATCAHLLLPHLDGRPLTLVRFPEGIGGSSFFQKDSPPWLPAWIPRVAVPSPDSKRKVVNYLVCNDARTLAYVANLGTIDLHPWASRVKLLESPDYVVWDLDPPEGAYRKAAEVAPRVREVLERAGLSPFLKTSGGKGLHLYAPLVPEHDHDAVRDFAELVARLVVETNPRATTLERSKAGRGGKVYVDFLQNGRGKTVVAPYSLRAKEPATVSTPITWEELEEGAEPADFTLRTVPGLVARRGDAWSGFRAGATRLDGALRRLSPG